MPIDDNELLAAVSASIQGSAPPADDPPDGEETPAGDPDPAAGDPDPAADGTEPPAGEPDPAAGEIPSADAPVPDGQMRGPDGRFVAKPKEGDPATAAAAAAAAPAAKPAAPVAKDPVNDPIPQGLKKETGERIQTLIKMTKEQTQKAETATAQFNEVMGLIHETRATPEQYGNTMNFLKLFNSGDPASMEQALVIAQNTVAAIAQALGKPVPGVDFLADHPDLKQAVLDGEMSQAHADELAALRASRKLTVQVGTQQTEQQKQQTELQRGRTDLNNLEIQLKADPHFAAKRPALVTALKRITARIPPSEWAAAAKEVYDALPNPAPAARPVPKPGVPAQQPFRGQNPAGGAQRAPASFEEAVLFGINQASR